ncbi:MAG TPA: GxxExxY protein, partial [Bacteroidales bacterium]|nr:GxxExxY protein [Bacteroidales bacterium]
MTQKEIDKLSYNIIGCAIEVHKELGPGLLENVYEKCLIHELKLNGYNVEYQV